MDLHLDIKDWSNHLKVKFIAALLTKLQFLYELSKKKNLPLKFFKINIFVLSQFHFESKPFLDPNYFWTYFFYHKVFLTKKS